MRARAVLRGRHESYDVLLAAAVVAVGQQETWWPVAGFAQRATPLWAMSLAYLVAAGALAWRRDHPLLVLTVVNVSLGILFVATRSPDGLGDLLPPVIAMYSIGRHGSHRTLPVAVLVTVAGVVLHESNDPTFVFDGRTATTWAVIAAAGLIGWAIRSRAGEAAAQRSRADLLERSRDEQAVAAVRAERDRLARELHDLVGHGMSLAVLQVVAAQTILDEGDVASARERLVLVERTARETLEEMRRLVAVSSGADGAPLSPQPGLSDVPKLVADLRDAGASVGLEIVVPPTVPAGVSLTAYRVVQEALTNVVRHAAAPAHVRISSGNHGLTIDVVDEGATGPVGFSGGRGLLGMQQRVALYGGTVEVSRRSPRGVRVCVWLPLEDETS